MSPSASGLTIHCGSQKMTVGDADSGHEGVGASVITGVDPSPVLEFVEHIFDALALAVEAGVVRDRHFAVRL